MIDLTNLFIFCVATLLVVIAPGPGMLFVISRGLSGDRKTGCIAAFGTSTGIAVHMVLAAVGLSLIIYASKTGFLITKWVGGIYLLFLAWKSFREGQALTEPLEKGRMGAITVFWQGLLVNALNPKVALFFLAFIPQFVDPLSGSIPVQTLMLGTIFLVLTLIVFTGYGVSAAVIRKWILERTGLQKAIHWAMGSLFVFLGLKLVLSDFR